MSKFNIELLQIFGERVRELRKANKLSQEELAAKAGIDRTYLSDIELGKTNVSLSHIGAIANGLSMTVAELIASIDLEPNR